PNVKPSERILAYCAIVLTLLAVTIWLKFFQLQSRPLPDANATNPVTTKRVARPQKTSDRGQARKSVQENLPASRVLVAGLTPAPSPISSAEPIAEPLPVASSVVRTNPPASLWSGAATIRGRVLFQGTHPKRKIIKTVSDPQCAAMHADNPL